MRDIGVVLVAAGTGTRAREGISAHTTPELKQFRWLAGKPMLLHSLQLFHSRKDVALVVCVLPRSHAADPPPWIFQCDVDRLLISTGGRERADSVRNGLDDIPGDLPYILVHDAARPFVPGTMLDGVVAEMRKGVVAVPALPVVDTIKRLHTGISHRVAETVDRARLVRAQTPQGFPRALLVEAHRNALANAFSGTDDASLCEAIGAVVNIVPGSERAMKITTEADFALAEALVASTT
jgi:2-C-methyl-D-erythritol 4-phosphate cytidylyltransferase